MASEFEDQPPKDDPEEQPDPILEDDGRLHDFQQIAAGVARAGQALTNPAAGGAAMRLRLAAEHMAMLGLYRDSFPAVADELRSAASGIDEGRSALGFTVFESLLMVPPRDLALEALGAASDDSETDELLAEYADLEQASEALRHALRQLNSAIGGATETSGHTLPETGGFPPVEMSLYAPGLTDASVTVLGATMLKMAEMLARMAEILIFFKLMGLCPNDECSELGVIDCKLDSLRVYAPVRQYSQYATSDNFKLGSGKAAEVIDKLADALLDFLNSGKIPKAAADALKALLGGAGFKAIVENWLKGKIGIDAVVGWIMSRIGPMLAGPVATTLAGILFVTLLLVVQTVALAKIYKKIITQPAGRGVLICATFSYTVCVDGLCYKYKAKKTINLRITPRSMGIFDTGSDLWVGQELGGNSPEDLITYQYLLDLIARLNKEIAKESDATKKLELKARKQAAEAKLKAMKKVGDFLKDLRAKAQSKACAALKGGDDWQNLQRMNFKPCG